jgi:hypothetical protein
MTRILARDLGCHPFIQFSHIYSISIKFLPINCAWKVAISASRYKGSPIFRDCLVSCYTLVADFREKGELQRAKNCLKERCLTAYYFISETWPHKRDGCPSLLAWYILMQIRVKYTNVWSTLLSISLVISWTLPWFTDYTLLSSSKEIIVISLW